MPCNISRNITRHCSEEYQDPEFYTAAPKVFHRRGKQLSVQERSSGFKQPCGIFFSPPGSKDVIDTKRHMIMMLAWDLSCTHTCTGIHEQACCNCTGKISEIVSIVGTNSSCRPWSPLLTEHGSSTKKSKSCQDNISYRRFKILGNCDSTDL